jgi:3-isopropylmalate/(R)-2-methylmalate dehydratase small subunit
VRIEGNVWKFGDHVDTDVIVPGKYLKLSAEEAATHVMEGIDPTFRDKISPGDIVVGGRNFGCGSSRESAPHALKLAGVGAVVAVSFARIFYRNAFNIGLPVIDSNAANEIREGDRLVIDLEAGQMTNLTTETNWEIPPIPSHLVEMLEAGGLIPHLERQYGITDDPR